MEMIFPSKDEQQEGSNKRSEPTFRAQILCRNSVVASIHRSIHPVICIAFCFVALLALKRYSDWKHFLRKYFSSSHAPFPMHRNIIPILHSKHSGQLVVSIPRLYASSCHLLDKINAMGTFFFIRDNFFDLQVVNSDT